MALNFPSAPNVGDTYGRWLWNGVSWVTAPAAAIPYLPLTGGTLTGNLNVDADTAIDGDLTVTNGIIADHVTTTGTSLDVAGAATIRGDLTVLGDADFDAALTIKGDPIATQTDVNEAVDAVKNLGLYAGAFATYAAVPTNTSAFPHLTQNDFITVHADENHNDDTTRYVASNIATDGTITWTYDITYSTDVSGKMDLVAGAPTDNLAMFDANGQVIDAGFSADDLVHKYVATVNVPQPANNWNEASATITHNLNQADVIVQVWRMVPTPPQPVLVDVNYQSVNAVQLTFAPGTISGTRQFKVVVMA